MVDLDEYRSNSLANWDKISGNWGKYREYIWSQTEHLSRRLVERLELRPGDTVLDVAAGTGDTGYLALDAIGDDGRLITTDFSPKMVEEASQVGEARGLANVEYRVLDAERMDLEDSSVDGVVSRFGYMLMADPAQALRETRRALREGRRLSFAVWGPPDRNPWAAVAGIEMVSRGHIPPPEPGAPGIFSMGDPARITELVTGAGFDDPEIESVEMMWRNDGPEDHWNLVTDLSGPLADAISRLDDGERDSVRTAVAEKVE